MSINATVLCCKYKLTVKSWTAFTPECAISLNLELEMTNEVWFSDLNMRLHVIK